MIINPATAGYDVVTATGTSSRRAGVAPDAESAGLQQGAYDSTPTPSGMAAFAQETGTSPTVATDYLPSNGGWSGLDGSGGSLAWLTGGVEGQRLHALPRRAHDSDQPSGRRLQLATGSDRRLRQLLHDARGDPRRRWSGQRVPAARVGVRRLVDGLGRRTPSAEASFASYFQQIVTAMRSVAGEQFRFVWDPDSGAFTESGYSVAAATRETTTWTSSASMPTTSRGPRRRPPPTPGAPRCCPP